MRVRWDNWEDTPLPIETPRAKNPPDGAVIDYYLAHDAGRTVTIEILDSSGTVVRRASSRSFADQPYVLAIVELDEGPRMTSNIVAAPESVKVGMPVTVQFDDVTPEHTLVKFKPA